MLRKTVEEGARVRVGGLAGRPELNGLGGVLTGFVTDKGRFAVAVERSGGGGAGGLPVIEHVLLKGANLTLVMVGANGAEVEVDEDDAPPPLE